MSKLFVILAEDRITYGPCENDDESCAKVINAFKIKPTYARPKDNANEGKCNILMSNENVPPTNV